MRNSKSPRFHRHFGSRLAVLAGAAITLPLGGAAATPAQQAYVKASNTDIIDTFGNSAAVSGDTMVIGAAGEDSSAVGVNGNQNDNSASASGAVYVFVRNGTDWIQQAYLKASNTGGSDNFGWSVAIAGDTVVVGAPYEDSNARGVNGIGTDPDFFFDSGAAYVFVRSGTNWSQQAYLKASNTGANDNFGSSVAVSGDTVVINGGGAAFVFVRSGTNWSQQAYLKPSNGGRVAVSGDTVVVGDDSSATNSGAAYVFVRNGTIWSQQAYLKASNPGMSDVFGIGVAVSGDTVAVGAIGEDSNATGVNGNQSDNSASASGAVYVFVRTGTNWSQQAYLKASNTAAVDQFGISVAVSGDTVVVGANGEDSNAIGVNANQTNDLAMGSGAAYVFVRSGTNWSQQAYLKASNTGMSDGFGWSVAVSGGTVVVGVPDEDSNATGVNGNGSDNSANGSGAAYVFTGLGLTPPPRLSIERAAGNVRVFWPILATDFVLEEVDALTDSPVTGWIPVAFPYQTNTTHISVSVASPTGNKFYRLRKP